MISNLKSKILFKEETSMTRATRKEIKSVSNRSTRAFVLCKASGLSLTDKFMQHEPNSHEEAMLMRQLEAVIKEQEIKDFFVPKADPSFDEEGNLCYVSEIDTRIARGKSYEWWEQQAINFCPERISRLGIREEFIAFLGVRIKKISKVEMTVDEAWKYTCATFLKSAIFKKVLGFSGTPMHRLLASREKNGSFWLTGDGQEFPLSNMHYYKCADVEHFNGYGWVICEK